MQVLQQPIAVDQEREWRLLMVAATRSPVQAALKRALDLSGALALLVALAPLLGLVALLVRCTSPGPILFRQQRVGQYGRAFWIYKFRTMVANCDTSIHQSYYQALVRGAATDSGQIYKLRADPRITPLGRWLRRLSLDELPQLFNVVRGEMSLVGPRPPITYEVDLYGPRERLRLLAMPGITGLWQVSGRNTLTFQQMIDLDLAYIERWSLGLDLVILWRTVAVLLTRQGAC